MQWIGAALPVNIWQKAPLKDSLDEKSLVG
jgi:hypothetical protein